jgi:hypothetical protein
MCLPYDLPYHNSISVLFCDLRLHASEKENLDSERTMNDVEIIIQNSIWLTTTLE